MCLKSGENLNDDTNQTVEASENAGMNEQDKIALDKIGKLQGAQFQHCEMTETAGTELFRLQVGSHGGSSVFFNRNGTDCRYSLNDGVNGSMYLARTPDTAMKEVFQHKKGLRESDLDNYIMGKVIIEKDIRVLQVSKLIKSSDLTLHELTTATRAVTQLLAEKVHSAGLAEWSFRQMSPVTHALFYGMTIRPEPGWPQPVARQVSVSLNIRVRKRRIFLFMNWAFLLRNR